MKYSILLTLFSCLLLSCNTEKDRLVKQYFIEFKTNQETWVKFLESTVRNSSLNKSEVRRIYFSLNSSTSRFYQDIVLFQSYFKIDNYDLLKIRGLLDQKDQAVAMFYKECQVELITLQNLSHLLKIEKQLLHNSIELEKGIK